VIDFDAASTKLAIAEMQKRDVCTRVFKFATWRCQSEADAKDLLADALLLVYDPERKPWQPAKCSFFAHMRVVMDALASDQARSGHARFEVLDANLAVDDTTRDTQPLADQQLYDQRKLAWMRKLGVLLVAKVEKKHPLARQVFDHGSRGTEKPAELAQEIGCPVEEVYEAMELLKYHAKQILAEDQEAERRRMNEARRKAEKKETPL
jgi:DNA-directed RNA polymerase specialized sigma24 family protein